MTETGKRIPELRVEGFTDDWEQRKLGEITESYSGGTPSVANHSYYGGSIPFIRSAEINSINTELYLTEEGLNSSSAKLVEEGDILYALYGATSGEVGISQINGAINQAILAIKPKSKYDPNFIMQWLRRQKNSIISTYLQGGQGNLSGAIVKDLILSVPIEYDEQIRIGAFFKQLDNTIALHQRQLSNYKEMKTALLQKMFPKDGEKMPEVRFEGFTGEWEERKLGDVIVEYSDKDNSKLNPAVAVGKYGIRRREDIYKKALSKDISKNKVIRKNTLTIGMGSKQIDIGILKTDEVFSVSPAYSTFNIIDVDARYLDLFLQHENKNLSKVCMIISARQGKTVDKNLLVQYNVLLPSIPEQQKIADFLFILDGQIEAQKAAFDALNRLKQGLLQQMFV